MKVEIIKAVDYHLLERLINTFIKHKDVLDIKFSTVYKENNLKTEYSALIMYKE